MQVHGRQAIQPRQLSRPESQAPSGYVAVSADKRRLIIGSAIDGKVYFLRGVIR